MLCGRWRGVEKPPAVGTTHMVVDLNRYRLAKGLHDLDDCRRAQEQLRTSDQLEGALRVLNSLHSDDTVALDTLVVDALGFAVDALCNEARTAEARVLATDTVERVAELAPRASVLPWIKSPRTLPAVRSARILAQAMELDGDPDDALRRLLSLDLILERNPSLGEPVNVGQERLRILRSVLSAAKRDDTAIAHRFAARARHHGDVLASSFEHIDSEAAAGYWHRAACELRIADTSRSAGDETVALFRHSLPLRANTPRDRETRGLVNGDLLVLSGEREGGARLLSRTVEGLRLVLPRHHQSARDQLIARDLLRVA